HSSAGIAQQLCPGMKFPESRQLAPVRQRILGRKRQLNNIGPFHCFDHVSPFAATPNRMCWVLA
ncbi:MAG: hypothetical protein QOF31_5628, partial [Mycobacterium sp.]|nr:hypothetical protein [Mycobacterium sp.]